VASFQGPTLQLRTEADYFSSSPLFQVSAKLEGKESWMTGRGASSSLPHLGLASLLTV